MYYACCLENFIFSWLQCHKINLDKSNATTAHLVHRYSRAHLRRERRNFTFENDFNQI